MPTRMRLRSRSGEPGGAVGKNSAWEPGPPITPGRDVPQPCRRPALLLCLSGTLDLHFLPARPQKPVVSWAGRNLNRAATCGC